MAFADLLNRQTRLLHKFVCGKSEPCLARSLLMAHARIGDNTLTNALLSLLRIMRRDSAAEGLEALAGARQGLQRPSTAFPEVQRGATVIQIAVCRSHARVRKLPSLDRQEGGLVHDSLHFQV
jgi:hypothetical protein